MARRPGVVLRVSTIRALVWRIESTIAAVMLAIPLRWQRKFNAVRSAVSSPRAGPSRVPMTSPADNELPSVIFHAEANGRVDQLEGEAGEVGAGQYAKLARADSHAGLRPDGDDGVGGQVASAAEIFQQGRANERLQHHVGEGENRHGATRGHASWRVRPSAARRTS